MLKSLDSLLIDSLSSFEASLGYRFKDKSLLLNSLVHKSYSNEQKSFKYINNEKLE
ncbi:MAG TPA: ribonuclease III, partial [Fusobacteria bacterium]|nr:ribonuclease III [Fusobacteriota bacterium]